MDIFLSWHGPSSLALAKILREWLPTVLPYADPWLSSEDIGKGRPWDPELTNKLEATSHAIVCVTTLGVARAPWVNFEAGAVSKYIDNAHVSPLLLGVSPEDLGGMPLSRFQCTRFDKEDIGRLLRSINAASSSRIDDRTLDRNLRNAWKQLKEDVGSLDLIESPPSSPDDDNEYYDDGDDDEDTEAGWHLLERTEEDILLFVAESNSFSILPQADLNSVCNHISEHRLRVEHYLDRLIKIRFLQGGDGLAYSVTPEGRAYLVDNDLV